MASTVSKSHNEVRRIDKRSTAVALGRDQIRPDRLLKVVINIRKLIVPGNNSSLPGGSGISLECYCFMLPGCQLQWAARDLSTFCNSRHFDETTVSDVVSRDDCARRAIHGYRRAVRSEEHTSELQSLR